MLGKLLKRKRKATDVFLENDAENTLNGEHKQLFWSQNQETAEISWTHNEEERTWRIWNSQSISQAKVTEESSEPRICLCESMVEWRGGFVKGQWLLRTTRIGGCREPVLPTS